MRPTRGERKRLLAEFRARCREQEPETVARIEAALSELWLTSAELAERSGVPYAEVWLVLAYLADAGRAERRLVRTDPKDKRTQRWQSRRPQLEVVVPDEHYLYPPQENAVNVTEQTLR